MSKNLEVKIGKSIIRIVHIADRPKKPYSLIFFECIHDSCPFVVHCTLKQVESLGKVLMAFAKEKK